MFIGRQKELADMNRLYAQQRFQMFVLYGRRRVGKTTLLKAFCQDKPSIFYSAEQSTDKSNLDKFSQLVFVHYQESALSPFSSWENAIRYIHQRQQGEPLVLVFDEFPYLAAGNPAILSQLQHLIDHELTRGRLYLILCGSYMGFMEKEVLGSRSPLFGRRTGQMQMKSFDYRTSISFMKSFSSEEKLVLYGAFGGTPMYLAQIQPDLSMKDNIINCFMRPSGYLYEETQFLLRQELQEPGTYSAIIEAIASGASRANEIATKCGELSAKCLKYMNTLMTLGIIERETPFGEKETSRKTVYRLSDFMFRFWYRYVFCNKTLLETDAQEIVWRRRVEPDLSNYMGAVFEKVCQEYLLYKNARGELPLLFTEIGRWWGTDSSRQEAEVDIVARDGKNYLLCECKWRNEPTDLGVLKLLQKRADSVASHRNETWYALFSKSGFTDAVMREAAADSHILLVTLNDLLSAADKSPL